MDGTWNLTLFIEHGRIIDKPNGPKMLSGLLEISNIHQGEFRMTATQNLMISKVEESKRIYRKFSTKKWVMERCKLNSSK